MLEKIQEMLAEALNLPVEKVTADAKIVEDLGADSLTVCRIVIETEETFDVALDMEQFTSDATVGDLAGAVLAARFSQ
jgi:acyl carrier protein